MMAEFTDRLDHTILAGPLRKSSPVVMDCGSNYGEFAAWINDEFGATVYGYEPDPRLFPNLRGNERVSFFPTAIAGTAGEFELNLGESQCSSLHYREAQTGDVARVEATTLEAEFGRLGLSELDLLKLDIEGAELGVLLETPAHVLKSVVQITTEFHDFLDARDLPRIRLAIARMRELGFYVLKFSTRTYGDVLFVNRSHVTLSFAERALVMWRKRYVPGALRTWDRTRRRMLSRFAIGRPNSVLQDNDRIHKH